MAAALAEEGIPLERIPPEYGGTCETSLYDSPEERNLRAIVEQNNARAGEPLVQS